MNNNSSGPFARLGEGHGHMLEDYMKFKVNNNINQILTFHKLTFLIAEPCNSFREDFLFNVYRKAHAKLSILAFILQVSGSCQ